MQLRFSKFTKLGAGMSSALLLLAALLVLLGTPVNVAATGQQAQEGSVDLTFKSGSGPNGFIMGALAQADGKIIIKGRFNVYDNYARNNLARLNLDGSVDPTFNPGFDIGNIRAFTLQEDGKIVIAGNFTSYNGTPRNNLARLNSDGTLDTTFDPGTVVQAIYLSSVVVQSDGKIVVAGLFRKSGTNPAVYIARFNPNGSLDATFTPGTGANYYIQTIALVEGNKLLISGAFTSYNGTPRPGFARLNSDGSLDTTFDPGFGVSGGAIYRITVQNNGKIIIAGSFSKYNGFVRSRLARINQDGTLDTSFNPDINYASSSIEEVVEESDGKILVGGNFRNNAETVRRSVARFNLDGSLDPTFNPGTDANGNIFAVAVVKGFDKVVVGGDFTSFDRKIRSYVALLDKNGNLDPNFNDGHTGANGFVEALEVLSDDKIVIAGYFIAYNAVTYNRVARLNEDGTPDYSFVPRYTLDYVDYISTVAVQNDGKVMIGGRFGNYNNTRTGLLRLNADGTFDPTFSTESNKVIPAYSKVKVLSNGKILFAGMLESKGYTFVRFNENGTLDTTFTSDNNVEITDFALQSDGKIVVVGDFTAYKGTARNRIARLNADGTLDTTFNPGSGADYKIQTVKLQNAKDEKIIIGGDFTTFNGTSRYRVARLNSDGSLDSSFTPPATSPNVEAIYIQKNGKVLIGGRANETEPNRVIRLNLEGTLDSTFDTKVPSGAAINAIEAQSTGKILIGGSFTSTNDQRRDYIARLNNGGISSVALTATANPVVLGQSVTFAATVTPITATGTVRFTFGDSTNVTGTLVNGTASYMTNTLPMGTTPVKATYTGDSVLQGSVSAVYSQVVVATCDPSVVTNSTDDGKATTCGTFSYALVAASSGMTVTFALTNGNAITFTGSLTPTLGVGVAVDGGANGVVLDGNNVVGDGLRLGGDNRLINLTIRHFAGRELVTTDSNGGNRLYKVKIER